MSTDDLLGPTPSGSGRRARAVLAVVGLLVVGAAFGFIGRLLWPRKRPV